MSDPSSSAAFAPHSEWRGTALLPAEGYSAVVSDVEPDAVIVYGGRVADACVGGVWCVQDCCIREVACGGLLGVEPRCYHAAAVACGVMVVLHGLSHADPAAATPESLAALPALNLTTFEWEELCTTGDVPPPRSHHSADVLGSCLFVVGGFDLPACAAGAGGGELPPMPPPQAYQLNLETLVWRALEGTLPGPSRGPAAATAAGALLPEMWGVACVTSSDQQQLMVFPGVSCRTGEDEDDVWVYRPAQGFARYACATLAAERAVGVPSSPLRGEERRGEVGVVPPAAARLEVEEGEEVREVELSGGALAAAAQHEGWLLVRSERSGLSGYCPTDALRKVSYRGRGCVTACRAGDGHFVACGGRDKAGRPLSDAWALDVDAERWTRLADAPCAEGVLVERFPGARPLLVDVAGRCLHTLEPFARGWTTVRMRVGAPRLRYVEGEGIVPASPAAAAAAAHTSSSCLLSPPSPSPLLSPAEVLPCPARAGTVSPPPPEESAPPRLAALLAQRCGAAAAAAAARASASVSPPRSRSPLRSPPRSPPPPPPPPAPVFAEELPPPLPPRASAPVPAPAPTSTPTPQRLLAAGSVTRVEERVFVAREEAAAGHTDADAAAAAVPLHRPRDFTPQPSIRRHAPPLSREPQQTPVAHEAGSAAAASVARSSAREVWSRRTALQADACAGAAAGLRRDSCGRDPCERRLWASPLLGAGGERERSRSRSPEEQEAERYTLQSSVSPASSQPSAGGSSGASPCSSERESGGGGGAGGGGGGPPQAQPLPLPRVLPAAAGVAAVPPAAAFSPHHPVAWAASPPMQTPLPPLQLSLERQVPALRTPSLRPSYLF